MVPFQQPVLAMVQTSPAVSQAADNKVVEDEPSLRENLNLA